MRNLECDLLIWGLAGKSDAERHRWPLVVLGLFYQSLESMHRWRPSTWKMVRLEKEVKTDHGCKVNVWGLSCNNMFVMYPLI